MTGFALGTSGDAKTAELCDKLAAMPARRPALSVAAAELAFLAAAFACGVFDAPIWLVAIVAFAMLAYWSWSRRVALNRLRGAQWATQTLVAVTLMIVVLAGAYWLGLAARGLG